MLLVFFFFKQKTAYEMRISDWSSDVCSSDLFRHRRPSSAAGCRYSTASAFSISSWPPGTFSAKILYDVSWAMARQAAASSADMLTTRSEEHTSELQSLMRISYAVFCLKNKKRYSTYTNTGHKTHTNITRIHNRHTVTT